MADTIQFTNEEQQEILTLRQEVQQVFTQLGQVRVEREKRLKELESFESQLLQRHSDLSQKEQELFASLNEKYGDGSYDPDTGVFTPQDSVEEADGDSTEVAESDSAESDSAE